MEILWIESFQRWLNLEGQSLLGIGLDRYAHFGLSFVTWIIFQQLGRQRTGLVVVLTLIIGKELLDGRVLAHYNDFRWIFVRDMLWDTFAGLAGLLSGAVLFGGTALSDHRKFQNSNSPFGRCFYLLRRKKNSWWERYREAQIDRKFGGSLEGRITHPKADQGYEDMENSPYPALKKVFSAIEIRPDDVIVDVGCGKGRVINWILHSGLQNRVIGLEMLEEIAEGTRQRLKKFSHIEIKSVDILQHFPHEGSIFFMYNPFGEELMQKFVDQLDSKNDRPVVLYFNCLHLKPFEKNWNIVPIDISEVSHKNAVAILPKKEARP